MLSTRLALALFVLPAAVIAQNIPVTNWTVPPYRAASAAGGHPQLLSHRRLATLGFRLI